MKRLAVFLFTVALCGTGFSQLEKLIVEGKFTDAATGAPIIDAQMVVTDSLDKNYIFSSRASAQGEFYAGLYSGAHYVLHFVADGYWTRCAVIDLKMDRDWPDVSKVWHIKMPMPMEKAAVSPVPAPTSCEWRCVFQPRTSKLEWVGGDAGQRFPIVIEANERSAEELEMSYEGSDNRYLLVKGYVKELQTDRGIPGATVRFIPENGMDSTVVADAKGYYEMKMTFDQPFRVEYAANGKVAKIVEIDPRTVPNKERKQGFVVWTDITLFEPVPGADFSFLHEPIGKSAYDAKSGTMAWDMDYSLPIMERLNNLLNGP